MTFDLNLEGHSTVQIIHKDVSVVSHVFCNYHSLLTLGMGFFFSYFKIVHFSGKWWCVFFFIYCIINHSIFKHINTEGLLDLS